MKRSQPVFIISLLLIILATHSIAEERINEAKRAADSRWVFLGGSACYNCDCDSEGKLPKDFPVTDVHAVTFYLLASHSNSKFDEIQAGRSQLKLILGNSQVTAQTTELHSEKLNPVTHKWSITFMFSPPVRVGPGTGWKLMEGNRTRKCAAVAHTIDKPSAGLPGKHITKNCQCARTEDHWYSVKFDFSSTASFPPEGLKIVEKGSYDISVQLNGKEIYSAAMFDIGIIKSFKNIEGYNVDVLVENAGGNICQTYSCRIISWRSDGQYKISDSFGNCQGPEISQEGNKIFLAFESYTMRHSGKAAPAQLWAYEDGVLRQVNLPVLHPRPILLSPQKDALLPQGNNPDCPEGHVWNFSWSVPNPQDVRLYNIRFTKPWLSKPIFETNVEDSKYTHNSCKPID
ncbi:MAG: hypothetical protein PVI11_09290, partial [Candidatus Aminicenantes bacterium]